MKFVNVIFATDKNGVFGVNGKLPWSCQSDLNHFNRITQDSFVTNTLVCGRKTFESIGRELPMRKFHILSGNETLDNFMKNLQSFKTDEPDSKIFIIGGANIITETLTKYLNVVDTVYYTRIKTSIETSDADEVVRMDTKFLNTIIVNKTRFRPTLEADFFEWKVPRHEEFQYLELCERALQSPPRQTRNAITHSMFNSTISFDLSNGIFPLITTKKVFMRGIFEELMFFLRGQTDSKILENKGVNIWKWNSSQEFIDKCGLPYNEGDIGPMYGWIWKHYGEAYENCKTDYTGKGYNQIEYVLDLLKNDPFSRRILMTTYNPAVAKKGVLYPCHSIVVQFFAEKYDGSENISVSMSMYQRSVDLACGLPFNIASNALLLNLICKTLTTRTSKNYTPNKLNIVLGDIHIYNEHVKEMQEQIKRMPMEFPTISINKSYSEIEEYNFEDITINNYNSHPAIKYQMVA